MHLGGVPFYKHSCMLHEGELEEQSNYSPMLVLINMNILHEE